MDAFKITGGKKLKGEISISGGKNATLPIMAACLLVKGEVVLHNVPKLRDIRTMKNLLTILGAKITEHGSTLTINSTNLNGKEAPYSLVKTMRASFIIMGPLLARLKSAKVSLPGGCAIGSRPVDIHIKGFRELSAKVQIKGGYAEAEAVKLKGKKMFLDFPSVGATENIMLAASLAEGETIIENSAREPEIIELANFLNQVGAKVTGAGSTVIKVNGVSQLFPAEYQIGPDRIEAGTFMIAAGITGGELVLNPVNTGTLVSVIQKLRDAGMEINILDNNKLLARSGKKIQPVRIKTMPFPGFPTDMQPQIMSLLCFAEGTSVINETIFENRFMHVSELRRMGANIRVEGHNSIIEGVRELSGAEVMCSDLRAGAAIILASLAAQGESLVQRVYHVDRGYEEFEHKLLQLGAGIQRVKVPL
ncbi:MAG: UDP-N-acetylglucosamine 1-carboxyvinyltransferase [Candidatus Wallbacteria bacterium]|nr:UDP-N-acetylglucosamine 1-carboxyvinyltransferase [Candidatus Wallbacteria bacterium]